MPLCVLICCLCRRTKGQIRVLPQYQKASKGRAAMETEAGDPGTGGNNAPEAASTAAGAAAAAGRGAAAGIEPSAGPAVEELAQEMAAAAAAGGDAPAGAAGGEPAAMEEDVAEGVLCGSLTSTAVAAGN